MRNSVIYAIIWLLLMIGAVLLLGIGRGADVYTIVCDGIVVSLSCLITIFLWFYGRLADHLHFDAPQHPFRFYGVLITGAFFCVLFSILPDTGWLFLSFYILLSIVSNSLTGISGATTLLVSTMFMSGTGNLMTFLVYFSAGLVGVALFESVMESHRFALSVFLVILVQLCTISAGEVLFETKSLSYESFLIPGINLLFNTVILVIALKPIMTTIILPRENLYQTINDPEYGLMKELREKSVNDYFHALHTARLAENICRDCDLNADAVKTAAYYWKYGKIMEVDQDSIMSLHHFPEAAVNIINQMNRADNSALTAETTVLMFCDAEVNMMELFADKNVDIHSQYKTLVNKILDRKIENGILNRSKISVMDMNALRRYLLEDEMYYDFIRSNRV